MPLQITLELSDADLEYFRKAAERRSMYARMENRREERSRRHGTFSIFH